MKVSWRLLAELADLSGVSPDEAARLLPLRVADVEGVERLGALPGVVTARVLEVEPHPNADRLRLCTVDFGGAATLRVVCGAPNVARGQAVCFAPVGTTLPGGLTLKKAKIRGVESEGMICAEDELGLGSSHEGIIVLPEGTPPGRPAAEALGVADVVLDLNNTGITSRPDLWGHVGVARELAAVFGRPLRLPSTARAEALVRAASSPAFPVTVDDPSGCRRYVGLVLEGVHDGPSPAWLVRTLEAVGLRSVSLLVDLTNLVMVEQGQPLHAFDLREVSGRVVVRRARAGERMKTLDGKDLALDPEDLVIADERRVLALAGVMGGEASGVRADTTAVLLESACFDAARVRRSAIRHGLRTDASARFEKSLDPVGAWTAALRFVERALDVVPGVRVARAAADEFPRPYPPVAVDLDPDLVRRRLGIPLDDAAVADRLASVGFRCDRARSPWRVEVPSWRATKDVSIAEDLVEEVGRLHGYEHVRVEAPLAPMRPLRPTPVRALERDGRAALSLALGYAETATYAFHGAAECARLGTDPEAALRLSNPLSAAQDRLQTTCTQNLLGAAARNQPREPVLRLCEWTRVFVKRDRRDRALPLEVRVLGMLLAARDRADDPRGETFLALKDDVVAWLDRVGVGPVSVVPAHGACLDEGLPPPVWLHPGRRAALRVGDAVVALVGEVAPKVARAFDLTGRVATAEVHLDRVLAAGRPGRRYAGVARFPWSPFDVAVVVPRRTSSEEVATVLRRCAGPAVKDVALFDVYEGAGIPDGHRSLAFTVTFGDDDGTLKPAALEKLQTRALDALRRAGWTVRTGA